MQLQHLKYFLQIAETGSMNKAAKSLYVSQPSLSKAMSCLEEELSIQIIRRDNRGVSLTEDGKKLYMYTKNILNQFDLISKISSDEMPGVISVSAYPNLISNRLLSEYYSLYQGRNIAFTLRESRISQIVEDVSGLCSEIGVLHINNAQSREAHYNLFGLKGEDCYIDLLTDSGTNAMSAVQWGGVMQGDEAYAGAAGYYRLTAAGEDIFGYGYIQPVHQGRAAEKVLFPLLLGPGKLAFSNMFFDTTRAHVELSGARAMDCVVEAAKNPAKRAPFKGNMDVEKLESLILEHGPETIGLVVMTITNNSAGGQPVSLENMRQVSGICRKYGIPLDIDGARFAENAYFVKRDEAACRDMTIKEIIREMFGCADMFTMSAKKDTIVNMGGLIGVKDQASPLILKIRANCISYEGFYTYGGLAGRDLEALAIGLYEGIDENYLAYRIGQMEYLASRLDDGGISYQSPVGGHGVFVDAKVMFPQIPYYEFPGQALAVELYIEAGIRSCDIGSYMLGNDPDTGEQLRADFEFTRLAIPRRVYTQAHLDTIAEALIAIKERAHERKHGYRITWEPPVLRHFQAHLEPVGR